MEVVGIQKLLLCQHYGASRPDNYEILVSTSARLTESAGLTQQVVEMIGRRG
jgi:hypothetical protein